MALNPTKSAAPQICVLRCYKLHSTLPPTVLKYRPFWIKCTKWSTSPLEYTDVKGIPYLFDLQPESQITVWFTQHPAIFELAVLLTQGHQITPKWHLMLTGQRFRSATNLWMTGCTILSITGYFNMTALNNLKNTLSIMGQIAIIYILLALFYFFISHSAKF